MTAIILFIVAVLAFICGWLSGVKHTPVSSATKKSGEIFPNAQLLENEYRNFLNYDGSEQI